MDDTRVLQFRPPYWAPFVLIFSVIVVGTFYVGGKYLETQDHNPATITVNGEGKSAVMPDVAELSFGVTILRQESAKTAMDKLARMMEGILEAVKKAGIEAKDINTEQFSLNPAYDWKDGQQIARGYDASQSLRVKVRELDSVGSVLAAATNAGANQVGGVSFVADDPEKARAGARQKAIVQAQKKAGMLAAQLGMRLGKLKSFSEGGGYVPPYMPYARGGAMMMDEKSEAPPIPAGEQEVNVQVNLTYEVK
ncbi:SIMPL domain-containing protein [Candidatus Peregrinibacteria bacterium]|nr:SIMPL domain-containing protein [Candidatus Peregrinibacteria bacterium]